MNAHTRRETLAMLLSAVPSLSLVSLVGCKRDEPGGGGSGGEGGDDRVRPVLDAERLAAGLSSALAGSPWADRIDTLVEGAAAQIEALREAGFDDSADLATYGLNGVVANVAAGFGESLAARGGGSYELRARSEDIISELSSSCAGMRTALPGATAEISDALGGDTIPADTETAASVAEDEAELRRMMYEKGMSAQGGVNLLLGQLQSARADITGGFSLASAGAALDQALSGLASDEASSSARAGRRRALRDLSRPPREPDDDLCDLVSWVSFFTGWMGAIHSAVGETAERMAGFVDELPEAYAYLKASWTRWLATELTEEALDQTESAVIDALEGRMKEVTEAQCNQIAAFIIVVLWFVSLISTLIAFAQSISWLASTIGAFTPGGTIALVFILMLVLILYYVLELACAVIGILPTVEVMFGECGG